MTDEELDPAAKLRFGPPPLRIHHILVATVVTAVLLSVNEGLRQNDVGGFSQFFRSGMGVVYTISTGLAVTVVLFGVAWRRQGRAFFDQPGHWLLLDQSLKIGVFLFAAVVVMLRMTAGAELFSMIGLWFSVIHLLSIALNFWAAFRVADSRLWRATFLLGGCMSLAMFVIPWLGGVTVMMIFIVAGNVAVTLLLISAAMADRRAGRERDWAHWLGVALELCVIGAWLAQSVWGWIVASGWMA